MRFHYKLLHLVQPVVLSLWLISSVQPLLAADTPASLIIGHILIAATNNIFNAGKPPNIYSDPNWLDFIVSPNPELVGDGTLPKEILLLQAQQREMIFPTINGTVQCCTDNATQNTADGGNFGLGKTNLPATGGLSGIRLDKTMFLVGVFLNDYTPHDNTPAPQSIDFTGQTDFEQLTPVLNQIFFIGDGRNHTGMLQHFVVPEGATRLFLGFADGNEQGQVGFYNDNQGYINVIYQLIGQSTDLSTETLPVLNEGLVAYYTFEDAPVYDDGNMTFIGNVLDNSGFKHHGIISEAFFSTQPSKYGKSATFKNGSELALGDFPFLPNGEWSIATWVYLDHVLQYEIIYPRRVTMTEMCVSSPLYVQAGRLGRLSCKTVASDAVFQSTGFSTGLIGDWLNGWHHFVVVSDGLQMNYYVDGRWVGSVKNDGYTRSSVFLGNSNPTANLTLDEFRIYNRRLSAQEIGILSDTSSWNHEECIAEYQQWSGRLIIPCLTVADERNNLTVYHIELQTETPAAPDIFKLLNVTAKPSH